MVRTMLLGVLRYMLQLPKRFVWIGVKDDEDYYVCSDPDNMLHKETPISRSVDGGSWDSEKGPLTAEDRTSAEKKGGGR